MSRVLGSDCYGVEGKAMQVSHQLGATESIPK